MPRSVRLAAQGPRGRRRTQPARPAHRHQAHGATPRPGRARHPGRDTFGRHPRGRATQVRQDAGRRAHHHTRVAVPHPHQPGPRGPPRRRDRDRRRGARRRRHQARRPPRAQPRTPRRSAREEGPAHRPVRDRPPDRDRGEVPRRQRAGHDRQPEVREGLRSAGHRSRRGHGRAGAADRRPGGRGRRSRAAQLDLAARRGTRRRPGRAATFHDRLRQLPPAGRAPDGPAERDQLRAHPRRGDPRPRSARPGDGAVRSQPRRRGHSREGAPRFGQQGATRAHRGRPQVGPPALRGRHQQSRARHRHGRGRPRRPGRGTAVGRQRAAARRPRRPPGGRGLEGHHLPQVSRRPGHDRGRHRTDAGWADRGDPRPGQPARRPRPADRRRGVRRQLGRRRPVRPRAQGRPVR